MPIMLEKLYDALRAADVPDDKARAAAVEVAEFKDAIADIKSTLRLHTWMLSLQHRDGRRHPRQAVPALMRAAVHPGEFLAEILAEQKLTQAQFARAVGVSPMRVSHVINGSRPVTADLALRLAKAFDQTPEYWLSLQAAYDLAIARRAYAAGRRR